MGNALKKVLTVLESRPPNWVGDGFPMHPMFSFSNLGEHISPFLTMGYSNAHSFMPTTKQRGVGMHPHRGFETVTIVYDGEVEHHDTAGEGGTIGPGDVQWMTAGGGIMHDEFHAPSFAKSGGTLSMVQLWVNLPAKHKMARPAYQALLDADIPSIALADNAGRLRVIAGEFAGRKGPAHTFSPINLWDLKAKAGASTAFDVPQGHTALVAVLAGSISVNGSEEAGELHTVLLDRDGTRVEIVAKRDSTLLVMTGEPLGEPIVGYGPFVMNSEAEIRQAIADFNAGRFVSA
jgi:redox-sensitive bicupin YhaK (pirin superfamily)